MRDWLAKWWLEAALGGVVSFLGMAFARLRGRVRKNAAEGEALKAGIKALLRDRIIQAHGYYIKRGGLPYYARDSLLDMYAQYRALGGNGAVSDLVEEVKRLPTAPADG